MKNRIIQLGEWGQQNWLPLVIILSCIMMVFLVAVMVSWLVGYWCNALKGTHFELASCWSGISVVVTGRASVARSSAGRTDPRRTCRRSRLPRTMPRPSRPSPLSVR